MKKKMESWFCFDYENKKKILGTMRVQRVKKGEREKWKEGEWMKKGRGEENEDKGGRVGKDSLVIALGG